MEAPLVSVCMTAYNHEPYIAGAIESVLAQQAAFGVELVVGEDCSTDRTGEICREYAAKYPDRIRLVTSPQNVGMRANYKRVVEACRGRYIAMCDGDDWWTDPQKLQLQVGLMESDPGCGMCYCQADFWSEAQQRVTDMMPGTSVHATFGELMTHNTIANCTTLARRELVMSYYTEVRPLEKPWPLDDYGMWLWCAAHSRIGFLDRVMAGYRFLENSGCHFSDPRRRARYEGAIMDIRVWFDENLGGGARRRELARRRMLQRLDILQEAGFRAVAGCWARGLFSCPWLLVSGRGWHVIFRTLRKSVKRHLSFGKGK